MSDDPVRNGISRLDEMMSGAVGSTLRSINLMVACTLLYSLSIQIVGVTPQSPRVILIGLFTLPLLIVSWRPG